MQEICHLCLSPIDIDDPTIWKQVIGWVGGPKKDSMRLRENTDKFAHNECVAKLQAGQAIDQPSMFDEYVDNLEEDQKPTKQLLDLPEELQP